MLMVQCLHEDDGLVLVSDERLLVSTFTKIPTIEHFDILHEHGRALDAEYGSAALLNVALGGRPALPDDVRRAALENTRDPRVFSDGRAHVVLMAGLTGTAILAFINTMILLSRPPRPTRVLGSVDAAAAWLAPMLGWAPARVQDTASEALNRSQPRDAVGL